MIIQIRLYSCIVHSVENPVYIDGDSAVYKSKEEPILLNVSKLNASDTNNESINEGSKVTTKEGVYDQDSADKPKTNSDKSVSLRQLVCNHR